jgi:hypothetical protein
VMVGYDAVLLEQRKWPKAMICKAAPLDLQSLLYLHTIK